MTYSVQVDGGSTMAPGRKLEVDSFALQSAILKTIAGAAELVGRATFTH